VLTELATLQVRDISGVLAARQIGRELATRLALEPQDQVRVATALSEICRSALVAGRVAVIVFGADEDDLVLTVTVNGEPPAEGVAAAARLMDKVGVSGQVVRMTKPLPATVRTDLAAVSAQLADLLPQSTLDELRRNNQDLIGALEDLKRQKEQLLLLNAELQETNRGVMALYTELSEELEQTNRGVVALYAELDEKSEQLRAAAEAKDRFWANVSHELRTPLHSIKGLTLLLEDPGSPGTLDTEQLHQVELIRNSTSTLLALVNDLLDVAKAESGRLSIDPAIVALPGVLSTLRGLVRPLADGKPVNVVVSAEDAPANVLTDEAALTAILRNLLSNGIKYTDSGEVRLSVRRAADDTVEFRVTDTGTGIPPAHQERVFEEFYQVPGRSRGGTGLGLPYARRLAGLLGGTLTLTSEPGAGTTVVLSLPCGMPSVGTVLVADDDAGFRGVLRAMLTGIAGRVIEAEDGDAALAAVAEDDVDLVLADLRMPGMDGEALLDRLPAAMPAILITGLDIEQPPRAAALLRKDELTSERLAFTIRRVSGEAR